MSVVSVRVPKELKEKMSRVKEDWASHTRHMIEVGSTSARCSKPRGESTRYSMRGRYHAAESVSEDRDQA
jgi:hypothetical protein